MKDGLGIMPFDFIEESKRREKRWEEREEVIKMLGALMAGRQSAFVGAPPLIMKTKTLDEECVTTVLRFFTVEKKGCVQMFFGSFTAMMQVMPKLRRIPGDIDIQLIVGKQEAIRIVGDLFAKLKRIDSTLRINPEKPTIIETNKNGRWERAVDFHYAGEPPEDVLSPLAPIPSSFPSASIPSQKRRTEEQRLIDALDFYLISKTLLESAKMYNESKSIVEQWERLLRRYVELFEEEIDFDKLEVKHKDKGSSP
jgi:hypothetical protein